MANPWTVKFDQASPPIPDPTNANNTIVTFKATHTDGRTKSQPVPSSTWTVASAQAYAEQWAASLSATDAIQAKTNAALPGIQAYCLTNPTLATG